MNKNRLIDTEHKHVIARGGWEVAWVINKICKRNYEVQTSNYKIDESEV